jgi:hypothetical protein
MTQALLNGVGKFLKNCLQPVKGWIFFFLFLCQREMSCPSACATAVATHIAPWSGRPCDPKSGDWKMFFHLFFDDEAAVDVDNIVDVHE